MKKDNENKNPIEETIETLIKRENDSTPTDKTLNISSIIASVSANVLMTSFLTISIIYYALNGDLHNALWIIWFFLFIVELAVIIPAIVLATKQTLRQRYASSTSVLILSGITIACIIAFIIFSGAALNVVAIPFAFNPFW